MDDYDPDTTGDFDENTLDGSEGLDADVLTSDGEDLTVSPPDRWRDDDHGASLDERLAQEKPDFGSEPETRDEDTVDEDSRYVPSREEDYGHADFGPDSRDRTIWRG